MQVRKDILSRFYDGKREKETLRFSSSTHLFPLVCPQHDLFFVNCSMSVGEKSYFKHTNSLCIIYVYSSLQNIISFKHKLRLYYQNIFQYTFGIKTLKQDQELTHCEIPQSCKRLHIMNRISNI